MNELDLTNTQSVICMVILIGFLIYLNQRDRKKSVQMERENKLALQCNSDVTPKEDLNPCYGRYIQLAGVRLWR